MYKILFLALIVTGCQSDKKPEVVPAPSSDTIVVAPMPAPIKPISYSNQRFRNVTVTVNRDSTYTIGGEAQIFEANFSWVIEDGHNELKSGHQMTDAGAPAWGRFGFTVDVDKERQNSTLHLILYESSAKDGSRQHLLMIPLP